MDEFLTDQPFMAIKPITGGPLLIEGDFRFTATAPGLPMINDSYSLRITIPPGFPEELPTITELAGKIPRESDYHVDTKTGDLCLGTRIRLMAKLQEKRSLKGYSDACILPFLYAVSTTLQGTRFPFGETGHGPVGILTDYVNLIGLKSVTNIIPALQLILVKRRIANKMSCPCKCGRRLGKCRVHLAIGRLRKELPRKWVQEEIRRVAEDLHRLEEAIQKIQQEESQPLNPNSAPHPAFKMRSSPS